MFFHGRKMSENVFMQHDHLHILYFMRWDSRLLNHSNTFLISVILVHFQRMLEFSLYTYIV